MLSKIKLSELVISPTMFGGSHAKPASIEQKLRVTLRKRFKSPEDIDLYDEVKSLVKQSSQNYYLHNLM